MARQRLSNVMESSVQPKISLKEKKDSTDRPLSPVRRLILDALENALNNVPEGGTARINQTEIYKSLGITQVTWLRHIKELKKTTYDIERDALGMGSFLRRKTSHNNT